MCGCRKKSNARSAPAMRPTTSFRSSSGAGNQNQQQPQSPAAPLNAGGLSAERRKTQALRRDAIRKAFNK